MTEFLTSKEHDVIERLAHLYIDICDIAGLEKSRSGDLAEVAVNIHALQNHILAQAAARAYPDRYRTLGGKVMRRAS